MPMLYINCPGTGKPVATGVSMPQGADFSAIVGNTFICSACGQQHTWDGKDVIVVAEKPGVRKPI